MSRITELGFEEDRKLSSFYLSIFKSSARAEEVQAYFEKFLIETNSREKCIAEKHIVEHLMSDPFYKNEMERLWLCLKFDMAVEHLIATGRII